MLFDGVYLEESKTALLGERLQRKTTLVELEIVFCFSQSKDTLSRRSFENQTSSTSSRNKSTCIKMAILGIALPEKRTNNPRKERQLLH